MPKKRGELWICGKYNRRDEEDEEMKDVNQTIILPSATLRLSGYFIFYKENNYPNRRNQTAP
jgi:hypothetical protein